LNFGDGDEWLDQPLSLTGTLFVREVISTSEISPVFGLREQLPSSFIFSDINLVPKVFSIERLS
jgi:hypothetical protein